MNNSNGAALIARIKEGALVTVRVGDGSLITGRAYLQGADFDRDIYIRTGRDAMPVAVTANNVIQVRS